MRVRLDTIPHVLQRYNTAGDWVYDRAVYGEDELVISVSEMQNWRYEALIAVHELVEAILCREANVSEKEVDDFDKAWEGFGEPGDSPKAPYYRQHQIATVVERLLAAELGVDWVKYEASFELLDKEWRDGVK